MQIIRYGFLAIVAIVLVTLAMANREFVEVALLPDVLVDLVGLQRAVTLPLFVVILIAVAAGLAIGFVWEWIRERRERRRLEGEVKKIKTDKHKGDDVLALLE